MSHEHPLLLDPNEADARGEHSAHKVSEILSQSNLFPFITLVTLVPRFSSLDNLGVDLVADLDTHHAFSRVLAVPQLFIQVKSRDFHLVNFLKEIAEKYFSATPSLQSLRPLLAVNGQRADAEIVGDIYTQLFLYLGLLHDGERIIFPNKWESEILYLLSLCEEEVRNTVLSHLNGGVKRRNRGIRLEQAEAHPYYFERRDQTLEIITSLQQMSSG